LIVYSVQRKKKEEKMKIGKKVFGHNSKSAFET
jgi:hypothetical protein